MVHFFDMTAEEQSAVLALLNQAHESSQTQHSPDGYNIGVNIGKAGGQSRMHVHVHLIPRYSGDVADPRGGIRCVLAGPQHAVESGSPVGTRDTPRLAFALGRTTPGRKPMSLFLAFLFAAALLAITPGPGIAYVVARTVAGGRACGLASCLGTAVGGMVHVVALAFGLSALVAQSAFAFSVVKYAGATYLIFLGIRLLLARQPVATPQDAGRTGMVSAFRDGIVVEALNVKTAIFFLAFLPQFVVPTDPLVPQLVLLGSICVCLNTLVDVAAVFGAAGLLKSSAARAARARLLARVSGGTMVGLGIYLAAAKRDA